VCVTDGLLNDCETITVSVGLINDAPVANGQTVTTLEDTSAAITLSATDADGDPLTWSYTQPTHGLVTGTAPSLTYTPVLNYHGPDSFTFHVNDGMVDSNIATITITVTAVNDAPTALDQSLITDEDIPLPITLTGEDVDGDTLIFVIVSGPAHGTLSGTAPSVIYTPALNYHGPDAFTFTVSDGVLTSAEATVSIIVGSVNDQPMAVDDFYTVMESFTLDVDAVSGVLANDYDVDGDGIAVVLLSGTAHGQLTFRVDGSFIYIPDLHYVGIDTFEYQLTTYPLNKAPWIDTAIVTINVTPAFHMYMPIITR